MSTTDSWVDSLSSGNPVLQPFADLNVRPKMFGLTRERLDNLKRTIWSNILALQLKMHERHEGHTELARFFLANRNVLENLANTDSQDLERLGKGLMPVGLQLIQLLAKIDDPDLNQYLSRFSLLLVKDLAESGFNLNVTGEDNIPLTGPVIIAPNHLSHFDHWPVIAAIKWINAERIFIAGAAELWLANDDLRFLFGEILHVIPIHREGTKEGMESFRRCVEILRNGNLLLCYPSGGRSETLDVAPFKEGVALMAKKVKCNCPIVPAYIGGTYELWPKSSKYPLGIGPVTVDFGKPIFADGRHANDVTRELEEAVAALRDDNHRK